MAYQRYRGPRNSGGGLIKILAALAAVVVIFAAAFFYLQRFMVYTDEGAYLDIPFLRRDTPEPVETPVVTLEVVAPVATPPEVSSTPAPAAAPSIQVMRAVFVPAGDLMNAAKADEYIKLCEETGINSLILEMKSENGKLNYESSIPAAITSGASGPDTRAFIDKIKAAGIYLCAYVSCFKDNIAPRKIPNMSVKVQSGVIWLDARMEGWLNPYIADARQYIMDICGELSGLGFDEILLDNAAFPTVGKPALIHYGADAATPRTSCINGFMDELSTSLSSKGTALSASLIQRTVLDGLYADAGQDFAELADILYRVFVPITPARAEDEFDAVYNNATAVFDNENTVKTRLVPLITIDKTGSDTLKAILNVAGGNRGSGYLVRHNGGGYTGVQAAFE